MYLREHRLRESVGSASTGAWRRSSVHGWFDAPLTVLLTSFSFPNLCSHVCCTRIASAAMLQYRPCYCAWRLLACRLLCLTPGSSL